MAKQIIVTDSTSDLSHEYLKQHNIHVIPLSLTIDGKSYTDQVDISSQVSISIILKMMQTSKQVNHHWSIIETYEQLAQDDAEIISIHLSSGLSGTYNTVVQASHMVDGNITVIDSKSISFGLGYQIKQIVELISHTSTEEIVKEMTQLRDNLQLFVVIGQLNQLIKGGRISKTKGLIGNIMKIKPIGTLRDGKLEPVHTPELKTLGVQYLKKKLQILLKIIKLNHYGIAHANVKDFLLIKS